MSFWPIIDDLLEIGSWGVANNEIKAVRRREKPTAAGEKYLAAAYAEANLHRQRHFDEINKWFSSVEHSRDEFKLIRSRRIAVDASKVQVPKGLHQYLDVDVVVRHLTAPTPTMHRRAVAVQAASIVLESLNDTSQISDLAVAVFKVLMASELFKFGEAAQHLAPDATWLQWMTACGGIANHASFSQLIQLRRAVCDFFSGLGDAYLRSGAQVSVRSVAEPAPASFRHLVGQALRALEWSVRTDGCLSTFLLREHKQRCLQTLWSICFHGADDQLQPFVECPVSASAASDIRPDTPSSATPVGVFVRAWCDPDPKLDSHLITDNGVETPCTVLGVGRYASKLLSVLLRASSTRTHRTSASEPTAMSGADVDTDTAHSPTVVTVLLRSLEAALHLMPRSKTLWQLLAWVQLATKEHVLALNAVDEAAECRTGAVAKAAAEPIPTTDPDVEGGNWMGGSHQRERRGNFETTHFHDAVMRLLAAHIRLAVMHEPAAAVKQAEQACTLLRPDPSGAEPAATTVGTAAGAAASVDSGLQLSVLRAWALEYLGLATLHASEFSAQADVRTLVFARAEHALQEAVQLVLELQQSTAAQGLGPLSWTTAAWWQTRLAGLRYSLALAQFQLNKVTDAKINAAEALRLMPDSSIHWALAHALTCEDTSDDDRRAMLFAARKLHPESVSLLLAEAELEDDPEAALQILQATMHALLAAMKRQHAQLWLAPLQICMMQIIDLTAELGLTAVAMQFLNRVEEQLATDGVSGTTSTWSAWPRRTLACLTVLAGYLHEKTGGAEAAFAQYSASLAIEPSTFGAAGVARTSVVGGIDESDESTRSKLDNGVESDSRALGAVVAESFLVDAVRRGSGHDPAMVWRELAAARSMLGHDRGAVEAEIEALRAEPRGTLLYALPLSHIRA